MEMLHSIPHKTAVCSVLHFLELRRASGTRQKARFAAPCEVCPCFPECRADWLETMQPLFDAAKIQPLELSTWPPF